MLELIAMATMLIDHIGAVFFPITIVLRAIGRISFPIYCYLLVRGYKSTRNYSKYLGRLILLAMISQPLYQELFDVKRANVIFTLAICLLVLNQLEKPGLINIVFVILLAIFLSLGFEYGPYAMFLVSTYKYIKNPRSIIFIHILLNAVFFGLFSIQQLSILGSLVIMMLEEKKLELQFNRTIYRVFYPMHLLCLLVIKGGLKLL